MITADRSVLRGLADGGHVCWVVGQAEAFLDVASAVLEDGVAAGRKPLAFGPEGGEAVTMLSPVAAVATDPRVAFLDGGPLDPPSMYDMFREQTAAARTEGYEGVCLVADMDWLLAQRPAPEAIVAFELLLDRVVAELDATVVCAYRESSFDGPDIAGALAVHPIDIGDGEAPQFRLVAGEPGTWRLSGEIDVADDPTFAAAFAAATGDDPCEVDVSNLDFIDVAGMRVIAAAGRSRGRRIVLRGASAALRRNWQAIGYDKLAPTVELIP